MLCLPRPTASCYISVCAEGFVSEMLGKRYGGDQNSEGKVTGILSEPEKATDKENGTAGWSSMVISRDQIWFGGETFLLIFANLTKNVGFRFLVDCNL